MVMTETDRRRQASFSCRRCISLDRSGDPEIREFLAAKT